MPSKTTAKKTKAGQMLVSTMIALPILILAFAVLGFFSLRSILQWGLYADSYFLARAHLYQNQIERCAPSKLWPKTSHLNFTFSCNRLGEVSSSFVFNFANHSLHEHIKLQLRP